MQGNMQVMSIRSSNALLQKVEDENVPSWGPWPTVPATPAPKKHYRRCSTVDYPVDLVVGKMPDNCSHTIAAF